MPRPRADAPQLIRVRCCFGLFYCVLERCLRNPVRPAFQPSAVCPHPEDRQRVVEQSGQFPPLLRHPQILRSRHPLQGCRPEGRLRRTGIFRLCDRNRQEVQNCVDHVGK